jgi:hypothetical protein
MADEAENRSSRFHFDAGGLPTLNAKRSHSCSCNALYWRKTHERCHLCDQFCSISEDEGASSTNVISDATKRLSMILPLTIAFRTQLQRPSLA